MTNAVPTTSVPTRAPFVQPRFLGILGIFAAVTVVAAVFGDNFLTGYNLMNLVQRTALFSILALGAGMVIVTGGIDLSI